jgi:GTP pyrophosphokinase
VQVAEQIPVEIQRAIDLAHAQLVVAGVAPAALDAALPAARLVGSLTAEATLAIGALLHEALAGELPQQPPPDVAPQAWEAARELSRLGEFGGNPQWQDTARLADAQLEGLRKMLLALAADPRLVVARLGMQLARLRAARVLPEAVQRRLAAETRAVFGPLANRLGVWQVKWELEDLAFRYLEPAEYKAIAAALAERRSDRERYIAELRTELGRLLQEAGITAEVQGRPKHIYSIHRKMREKRLSFEQLFDVRALRLVCESIADCYAALGVVHGRWTNLPGEFDDYIATPKDNAYRSIHTAVLGPGGKPVEIQIRTREMHEYAELGVAAHWRYKEGIARDAGYARKIDRLRQLLAPVPGDAPREGPDFIEQVRNDLFADRVYALTPRGEVIDLPRGATPLDFAYQVHTTLGHRCRGAKVNGRITQLTQPLRNGEVVEIISGKQESPSRDWLILEGYLAAPRSRAKLRAWFRRVDASENEAAGRVVLERELARLGVGLEQVPAVASELRAGDAAQLYRWLGEGEVSVAQLQQAVGRLTAPRPRAVMTDAPPAAPAADAAAARRRSGRLPDTAGKGPAAVHIEGVGGLPMTLARCCAPAAAEPIAGYVALGRGVTIHAATCSNLQRMRSKHPERCLRAEWRS